jgi:hypothetical protein
MKLNTVTNSALKIIFMDALICVDKYFVILRQPLIECERLKRCGKDPF